jgi:hypothetical protein
MERLLQDVLLLLRELLSGISGNVWGLLAIGCIYVGMIVLVVRWSAYFNRNIGRAERDFDLPIRIIGSITEWIWRCVSCFTTVRQVERERIELIAHIDPHVPRGSHEHWHKLFATAYELLGILNHKAEALMVYSGVTLAVVGIANITSAEHNVVPPCGQPFDKILAEIIGLVMLASIFFSLIVVGIFWRFLEHAVPSPGVRRFDVEWEGLLRVLVVRQWCYQLAWLLAILAWALLVTYVTLYGL